ncbi:MAG: hypothetical protein HC892_04835 [Saprospiraceae bacterium]|nr:hypothetical protein [Saprospiraceae bacterium]
MRILFFLCLITIAATCIQCHQRLSTQVDPYTRPKEIEGLTFVAPRRPFTTDSPMESVKKVGAEWIAIIPYAFTRPGEPKVHYDSNKQWWGEGKEGCEVTIELAKAAGLKVMLKPQVWVPRGWTGDMDFEQDSAWVSWEKDYRNYILPMAAIAEAQKVDLFCLGTEFKIACRKRAPFWCQLIKDVRTVYKGKVTYAANWDEYLDIPFWKELDYVGVNAYFPLINAPTPDVPSIVNGWKPVIEKMERLQSKVDRPIIFTEFGYLSVAGCTYNTWELEDKMHELPLNEQAQANAYEALFQAFWNKKWWQGGFVWKWFPETPDAQARGFRDYTPQGKIGTETLKKWYAKGVMEAEPTTSISNQNPEK